VQVRVGKFAGELKMDACVDRGAGYARDVEFRISASNAGYTGHVVNQYQFTNDMGEASSGTGRINMTIEGSSTANYSSAVFEAYHQDSSESQAFTSHVTFTADAGTDTNTLEGAQSFRSQFSGSSAMTGQFGSDLVGSVHFQTTGIFDPPGADQCKSWGMPDDIAAFCDSKCPAPVDPSEWPSVNADGKCEFSDTNTESFGISNATTPPTFEIIPAAQSPYYEAVAAASLPSILTTEEVQAQTGWTDSWDCTAEGEYTVIDATSLMTVMDCKERRDNGIWRMCEEQRQEADQAQR
ncbi:MAG: hypothetical protein V1798_10555, partial [Pseudomonadota bacterium]